MGRKSRCCVYNSFFLTLFLVAKLQEGRWLIPLHTSVWVHWGGSGQGGGKSSSAPSWAQLKHKSWLLSILVCPLRLMVSFMKMHLCLMPFQCVVLGTSTQKKIVLSRSSGINGVIFYFEKDSSFKWLTVFDSGYASWLEEGRQDLIMFSFFLDVTRILIPSLIVFQNNITIDFKGESSMKLLLSYAVTIATLSQVSFMSKGRNPFSVDAIVQAFNFQAYCQGGRNASYTCFLKMIPL